MKKNFLETFSPEHFYHVYNRGNNGEKIFFNIKNYEFFLRRYDEYLSEFIETYAFCLLPNHFHFLIRVKDEVLFPKGATFSTARLKESPLGLPLKVPPFKKVAPLRVADVSNAFRRLFTSYAMAINKQENRNGSLFQKPFKRIEVTSSQYLANLVFYIHANPQLHGITDDFRMYPWSSYDRILKETPTKLEKQKVIEWFNDKDNYLAYHTNKINIETIKHILLED